MSDRLLTIIPALSPLLQVLRFSNRGKNISYTSPKGPLDVVARPKAAQTESIKIRHRGGNTAGHVTSVYLSVSL